MKPMLKAPGTHSLILNCDEVLSILLDFAFKFNVSRYRKGVSGQPVRHARGKGDGGGDPTQLYPGRSKNN
jgi:hypothetical protein